jgi:hypothetical protein
MADENEGQQGQGQGAPPPVDNAGGDNNEENNDMEVDEDSKQTVSKGQQPRLPAFDLKKHGKAVAEFLMQFSILLVLGAYPASNWGLLLFSQLPPEVMRLVCAELGIVIGTIPSTAVCTWEAVSSALKRVCCGADESDQGRLYSILRYAVPSDSKERYKKVLEDLEQAFIKLTEPLPLSVKIFFACVKVPAEHRSKFQYQNGQPWKTWEDFKNNWLAQSSVLESDLTRKANNNLNNGNKSNRGNKGPSNHNQANKRVRFGDIRPNGAHPDNRDPDAGPSRGFKCDSCGNYGHKAFWKSADGSWVCPNKARQGNKPNHPKKPS